MTEHSKMPGVGRFVIVPTDEAHDRKLDGWQNFIPLHRGWNDVDNAVYMTDDQGEPVKLLGWDGGEPEDQTLTRDWKWVIDALHLAYEAGTHSDEKGAVTL